MFDPKVEARIIAEKVDQRLGDGFPSGNRWVIDAIAEVLEVELTRLAPNPCSGLNDK